MTYRTERILIFGKTYPNPSKTYKESVCVGGLTDDDKWIRVYPVPFRFLKDDKKFKKWDVIEAKVRPARSEKFNRPESHKIDVDSIRIVEHVDAGSDANWTRRSQRILSTLSPSLGALRERRDEENVTMGIIKCHDVSLFREPSEDDSSSEEYTSIWQQTLDGRMVQKLAPPPIRFGFTFNCGVSCCSGHRMKCFDWEAIRTLSRNIHQNKGDKEKGWEAFAEQTEKLFQDRDVYFGVGTESRHNEFIIGGLFYPPKAVASQASLEGF